MTNWQELIKLMVEKFGEDSRIVQSLRDQAANQQYLAGAQEMYITGSVGQSKAPKQTKGEPR